MKALPIVALLLAIAPAAGAADSDASTSCISCHGNPDLFEGAQLEIVSHFAEDAHQAVGLSCHDCHGGNPSPELATDMDAAMNRRHAANPYRGVPERTEIPSFCGRCHSDPDYMRRFRPDARVDQEREYWTSRHGRALAKGDVRVATCVDCHGIHGIRGPGDPASSVYPTRVAETCRHCHEDAEKMSAYRLPDGRPLPIDQYGRWRRSVHAQAMFEKEDLSAPTCNDCHGNHGATPPGVESIAFVCGQCHGREAEIFRASPKREGFRDHQAYVADAGPDGCVACHDGEGAARPTDVIHSFTECTTCHGNHGIIRPTVAMLSPLPDTPCVFCHTSSEESTAPTHEPESSRRRFEARLGALLEEAATAGLEGEVRFDWLVDQVVILQEHRLSGSADDSDGPHLRPEFQRLYQKFRLGKTYYTYDDPSGSGKARAEVIRCDDCHGPAPEGKGGYATGADYVAQMRDLTVATASAERMILKARRGGVETKEAAAAIDRAVDAQIELEVLVHAFDSQAGSPFAEKHAEGIGHAQEAAALAQKALDDLGFRRKGLAISLVLIALVLVGLGVKIRQMST